MYSGKISGIGPRYCPSIEDKINKFSEKESHQIFIEPEGLEKDLVTPMEFPQAFQSKHNKTLLNQ